MSRPIIPWETREDVETLKRYKEIEADPKRLKEAQGVIKADIEYSQRALGIKTTTPKDSIRTNPATIQKLKYKI